MSIVRSIFRPLQSEFGLDRERGKIFVATLLAIIFPFNGSRSSQLLRALTTFLDFGVTRRRFYTFMASNKLHWDRLWQCVWKLIPLPLIDGRLILAADDSILPKVGKKIFGCDHHHDHANKSNQSTFVWSQNIVKVGLIKLIHGRFACIPLCWRFYRLKKSVDNDFQTKLEQCITMVLSIYAVFKQPILLVVDSWFANKTIVKSLNDALPNQFHLLSRLRTNIKLYDTHVAKKRKGRGRPRKYGKCQGSVKERGKKHKKKAKHYNVFLYGKTRDVLASSKVYFVKSLGLEVRIVWVYSRSGFVALFTTDLSLSIEKIIEYYGARWKIESGFKELKQDIGCQHSQMRNETSVTNHLNFCMMALALIWIYAAKSSKPPLRLCKTGSSKSYAFSDSRRALVHKISTDAFLLDLLKTTKPEKNNVITTILRLVA